MRAHYNAIAGQSVERLAALSDGLFAVAMTLLVLDLRVPAAAAVHSDKALIQALGGLIPRFVVYLMSFLTLGIFWIGQQTQLQHLVRSDRHLSWIHLVFLFAITLMPFSTSLMAEFITLRTALLVYWLNVFALGVMLFWAWRHAKHAQLLRSEVSAAIDQSIERRIVVAQALYGFGAALSLFSTYWSIGFIISVQLNYVIAPRIWFLSRI